MIPSKQDIFQKCRHHFEDIVAIRRDLHQHPETGFDVQRTADIVADELKRLGIATKIGVGQTGVVGDIHVPGATRRIALRADMDALPMQEQGNPAYKSTVSGKAHACGHDSHTAMLLGAARVLSELKDQLRAHVRFIFQPNEEMLPGGAPGMIADGVLDGVDEIYGQHVWPLYKAGGYGICPGPTMAQPDIFEIIITGKGGHAAYPNLAVDPIMIGAQVVNALQTIVSRSVSAIDTAVVSVTQFHAGTTHNVIPEQVKLMGTVRSFTPEVQQLARQRLEDILKGVTSAHGATYELKYDEGFPVTINHPDATEKAIKTAVSLVGEVDVVQADPSMGGEDFSYFSQQIPGCFVFLGIRNEDKGIVHNLHDPRFDIDEEAMIYGMALHVGLALG